ncbi:MAG: DUF58 domain-containing protein [Deltaproteobacteria bacterium]|nr:MAG: DUF58 domain-containing protein [Deltaproteobacteria bacterium]
MAGEYTSAFKGTGIEFEEVRAYIPGDDVRSIDWNVTARMGTPFVKVFREERELTVMLLVDVSSSGHFGTTGKLKNEVAAEVAALLAYAAIKSNDKVGLIIFTDRVEHYIPPKKGRGHVWRIIREVLSFEPQHRTTDLSGALEFLLHVTHKRAVCFVISDFIADDFSKQLRLARHRHDLIAVTISDPREEALPPVGFLELEDAETGETILIDTNDRATLERFEAKTRRDQGERVRLFRSCNVDHIAIRTDEPYVDPIVRFFRKRERRTR